MGEQPNNFVVHGNDGPTIPEYRHACNNGHEWTGQATEGWMTALWDENTKLCMRCWWEHLQQFCGTPES